MAIKSHTFVYKKSFILDTERFGWGDFIYWYASSRLWILLDAE